MRITVLTQPERHPFHDRLQAWCEEARSRHEVEWRTSHDDLPGGAILFIVSYHEHVPSGARARYKRSYVPHASALPVGRGWSPLEWQISEGATEITLSLILAEDGIDTGGICAQTTFPVPDHALRDEIEDLLFAAEIGLMTQAVERHGDLEPAAQVGEPTTYRRRTPDDSRLDPAASIEEQFDLLRIADPDRFPAFVDLRGHRYAVRLEKLGEAT